MVRSVAGLVMQAPGSLVEVDILELSESPLPTVRTIMGLGRRMVKELDLKLILEKAEKQ